MELSEYEQKCLESFYKTIEPHLICYRNATFSYLAYKTADKFELIKGKVQLHGWVNVPKTRHFSSENVLCGICKVSEISDSAITLINSFLNGQVKTPAGLLHFPPDNERSHSVYSDPFYSENHSDQFRQTQLVLSGKRRSSSSDTEIDWELRGCATPYENIQDLCAEFSLGILRSDCLSIEIIARNNLLIDSSESKLADNKARVVLKLAHGLLTENCSIGFRVITSQMRIDRFQTRGKDIIWKNTEHHQQGELTFEIPTGAFLQCYASYLGKVQHKYILADLSTTQNPYRAVHQLFDKDLKILCDLVEKSKKREGDVKDLEIAMAWLLWMNGFTTSYIGATKRTTDGPDLIANTPVGHFLIVECTTGILKEGHKLSLLNERTERVRTGLRASGNEYLRVLPVIVTTKSREEVKADLESAYKLGIHVICGEDIDTAIKNTLVPQNAEQLYSTAEESVLRNKASLSQSDLPLSI